MVNKSRALHIAKFLWDTTDEEHPATTNSIIEYLKSLGIETTRKTVAEDIAALQDCGFDIISNRSRQNEYFIGSRYFQLPELKLLVDAVQAAKFISGKKSLKLITKLSTLASPNQSSLLKRNLIVDGKIKTNNEIVWYCQAFFAKLYRMKSLPAFITLEFEGR